MASDTTLPIGSVAKALHKDFEIGRNKLFKFFRDRGVLMANNEPKQIYIDRGYFRVVKRLYEVHGEMRVGTQTLVYQRGVTFIVKMLHNSSDKAAA
ncbi:phage antirepressor KilAC domain-containing protein [Pseudodesulfovibrio tunisiensis]|uniref:phage antirepressor KilAC domain-containing protein n=1 Tax=Pseudodesulfovibrio tunisiensis TaxID=463192 RepID=UPI001FB393A0|nr:phage antirepressor KilAC domain-containing protein [Pseudodesulfovibrio tunisiensis]